MPWGGPLFDGHKCSLGYYAADWITEYCCHGPGDVQGEPAEIDDEILELFVDAYQLDPVTGRRIHNEVVFSAPKGRAKSEIVGWVACFDAFGECRFDGWDADGQPVGRRIVSPIVKCFATEEGQVGETFQNIAYIAQTWGPDVHPEIYGGVDGARRYQSAKNLYLPRGGEIRACTAGDASKDGGKESLAIFDETHLYNTNELRSMFATVSRNLPKRREAHPWKWQTTTMFRRGELSVAEATLKMWRDGTLPPGVLINHREAKGRIDIHDKERTLKQLEQVYGPAAAWVDLEARYASMLDPRECPDEATAARYYLNRELHSGDAFFDMAVYERQEKKGELVQPGEWVSLGFDGSLRDDSTVLWLSRMSDGFLAPIKSWNKPAGRDGLMWEVPRLEVVRTIREAFGMYQVARFYGDPHEWRSDIDQLAEEFGEDIVFAWPTDSPKRSHNMLDRLRADLIKGDVFVAADDVARTHFGNAYVRVDGRYRTIRKENPKSDRKIDSVMGAGLAYEARADAIAAGWTPNPTTYSVGGF